MHVPDEMRIVWLKAIHYGGSNIGPNTEFTISVNDQGAASIKMDIKHGATRLFQKPVYMGLVNNSADDLSVLVKVVERDVAVPDVGQNIASFTLAATPGVQAVPTLVVNVVEDRGVLGRGATASFTFEFEAERWVPGLRGVRCLVGDDNGWLLVRSEDRQSQEQFGLPHLVRVRVTRLYQDREHFAVLEGPLAGRKGSVALRNDVSSLSPARRTRGEASKMIYHKQSLLLEVPGLGSFNVARPPLNPFPVGATFHVEIPDFPHAPGRAYEKKSSFATSWFRIADPKVPDRYLHVGKRSAGCSTVTDIDRWDELYRFLINCRLDDRNVGTLTVVND